MKKVTFTCDKCNTRGYILLEDYEPETESEERSMGTYTNYWITVDTVCEKCGNSIEIQLVQTEYPVGDFQDIEVNEQKGCDDIGFS